MPIRSSQAGFSLVELTVASALLMVVMASVFHALNPAQGVFRTAPERADVQQRMRVALSVLAAAIGGAGGGPAYGASAGPLTQRVAAVFPYRLGKRNADPPGTARSDVITVLTIASDAPQTTLAQPLAAASGAAVIALDSNCRSGDASCGFASGDAVIVIGDHGHFDLFSVTAVNVASLTLQHDSTDSAYVYPAGASIAVVSSRTFFVKNDPANDQRQLARYDGGNSNDVPVVDHVVGLSFRYQGGPQAPMPMKDPEEISGPWSTYGPHAPRSDAQPTLWPMGENCVFQRDASANVTPRLPDLGGATLVELPVATFADGPWCADDADPNRFDADLLRIRSVTVTVRVEAGSASMRGPAGVLFSRAGTARHADRLVTDVEQTITVVPGNLETGR